MASSDPESIAIENQFLQQWAEWQVGVANIGGVAIASLTTSNIEIPSQSILAVMNRFKEEVSRKCRLLQLAKSSSGTTTPENSGLTESDSFDQPDVEQEAMMPIDRITTTEKKRGKKKKGKKGNGPPVEVPKTTPTLLSDGNLEWSQAKKFENLVEIFIQELLRVLDDTDTAISIAVRQITQHGSEYSANLRHLYGSMNTFPDVSEVFRTMNENYSQMKNRLANASTTRASIEKQIAQLQSQNRKLQEEIADYEREFGQLKNQDRQVRLLQEQLTEQAEAFEQTLSSELVEQEAKWQKNISELRVAHENEITELQKITSQKTLFQADQDEKINTLQKALLECRQSAHTSLVAKESELRLLGSEVEELRARIEASSAQRQRPSEIRENEVSRQISTLNSVVESLEQDLKNTRETQDASRKKWETQLTSLAESHQLLERQLKKTEERLIEAQNEVNRREIIQTEVTDLRRQIRTLEGSQSSLKSFEFSSKLKKRIQDLEDEIASIHNENEDLKIKKALYQTTAQNLSVRNDDLQKLVESLENQNSQLTASASGKTLKIPVLDFIAIGRSIDSFNNPPVLQDNDSGSLLSNNDAAPSLLEIATAQRQQLREKILEIEQDRDNWKSVAYKEQLHVTRLKDENAHLSERLHKTEHHSITKEHCSPKCEDSSADIELGSGAEKRVRTLRQIDEQNHSLSSLSTSAGRKLERLTQMERIIVIYGSAILSTRITRVGLICYCIVLHLLVIVSLHTNKCHSPTT